MKYIWDTNIAIYYLQLQLPAKAELFIDESLQEGAPFISAMTEIELLCWKSLDQQGIASINDFIAGSSVLELEKAVKLQTVEIRKQYRIKLPDTIIAASALVYNLTLLTRNLKDFKDIKNLKLLNPWDE